MDIEKELSGGILRLTLAGDLDLVGTEELDTALSLLAFGEVASIVVDMRGVGFVATSGWAALLELGDRWRGANRTLGPDARIVLSGLVPRAFASLETAGIEGEFLLEK